MSEPLQAAEEAVHWVTPGTWRVISAEPSEDGAYLRYTVTDGKTTERLQQPAGGARSMGHIGPPRFDGQPERKGF